MSGQANNVDKIPWLGFHMALGLATLIIMIIRIVSRLRLSKPPHASTGNILLDRLGIIAPTLLFLILLHIGAAFYHQFVLKDNLLARMWYMKS